MILIVSKDTQEADQIGAILAKHNYAGEHLTSIEMLASRLNEKKDYLASFIDIDSVPVDNRRIRMLTLSYPAIYFFCMSRDKFHPELKDAICYHIYACLNKPIDPDEMIYWLRCVGNKENKTRDPVRQASQNQLNESG